MGSNFELGSDRVKFGDHGIIWAMPPEASLQKQRRCDNHELGPKTQDTERSEEDLEKLHGRNVGVEGDLMAQQLATNTCTELTPTANVASIEEIED